MAAVHQCRGVAKGMLAHFLTPPRVGGVESEFGVIWCGGRELGNTQTFTTCCSSSRSAGPPAVPGWTWGNSCSRCSNSCTTVHVNNQDVLCYRPQDFRAKQRMDAELKKGLEEEHRLDLPKDGKHKVTPISWIQSIRIILMEQRGVDTVFWVEKQGRINRPPDDYIDLLTDWGKLTLTTTATHTFVLSWHSERVHHKPTDMISRIFVHRESFIRNSLGVDLLERVSSIVPIRRTWSSVVQGCFGSSALHE